MEVVGVEAKRKEIRWRWDPVTKKRNIEGREKKNWESRGLGPGGNGVGSCVG